MYHDLSIWKIVFNPYQANVPLYVDTLEYSAAVTVPSGHRALIERT